MPRPLRNTPAHFCVQQLVSTGDWLIFNTPCLQGLLRTPAEPPGGQHVLFEQFWIERGDQPLPENGAEADGEQAVELPATSCAVDHAADVPLLGFRPVAA